MKRTNIDLDLEAIVVEGKKGSGGPLSHIIVSKFAVCGCFVVEGIEFCVMQL